jgi:hypothetical protein
MYFKSAIRNQHEAQAMLRRNKHSGPRPQIRGRRRLLGPEEMVELCEHVAKGATVEDAAETVGVSLRTVQRERKLDEDFDHELQLSLRQPPDPLKMMQHAARAHWRAAAWLLERTDPAYAKRPKDSASPAQFHAGLEFVMEAALAGVPPELHEQVYEYMTAAADEAFECLFPNFGRWGDAKRPKLPATPLVQQQRRQRHADPKFQRVIAEDQWGRITETVPPQLPPHLQPRALPKPPWPTEVSPRAATPGRSPGLKTSDRQTSGALRQEQCDAKPVGADAQRQPPPAPEGRTSVARGASPGNDRQRRPKPQRGDVARALPPSRIRNLPGRSIRSFAARTASSARRLGQRILSPKMRFTTKRAPDDAPSNHAPVSREAAAERGPALQPLPITAHSNDSRKTKAPEETPGAH